MDRSKNEGRREPPLRDGGCDKGNVLVPCLFVLSLISLLTMGILNIGGVGSSVSEVLAENSQARLAALSGLEIAYDRLARGDAKYIGEECEPLGQAAASAVSIAVKPLGNSTYEVLSRAKAGESESIIRTKVMTKPWVSEYPLAVGGNLQMYGDAMVLGDTFISKEITGKPHTRFVGDVSLAGDREIVYDEFGNPVMIDGLEIPEIEGQIRTNCRRVVYPGVKLETLKAIAISQGQYYTTTQHFTNKNFKGVVYFDNPIARPFFKDVTLKGVLVCPDVAEIRVESGFLKIRADDSLCPNVAVLAPNSNLWVDPNGKLDVFGLTYVFTTDFQGKATFTGPVMAVGDLYARPDSLLYFQFPSEMKNFLSEYFEWSDLRVIELEYEEL